jgi:hypothetical protein
MFCCVKDIDQLNSNPADKEDKVKEDIDKDHLAIKWETYLC